jgi:hypothetical protein
MPLQQVKIMFTPEAAHKINAACKGSSVSPLDSENQRVLNDVFDHGVDGPFYAVELNSGVGYKYPSEDIKRIRSAWQEEQEDLTEVLGPIALDDDSYLLAGFNEQDTADLIEEFAAIELEYAD